MRNRVSRSHWLFRHGVWIRRALMGVAISILVVGKASRVPDNSPAAKALFFVVAGVGAIGLLLFLVEYLLAVRYRGYWFDHDFD